jgi:hypothetical protein
MKENNYPSWLVPVEIAKKLREIGFDKECIFVLTKSNKIGFTTKEDNQYHLFEEVNLNSNLENSLVCIPTWEQVFEWFRDKGLHSHIEVLYTNTEYDKKETKILEKPITLYCYFTGHSTTGTFFFSMRNTTEVFHTERFKSYEKCREAMVNSLIDKYKKNK